MKAPGDNTYRNAALLIHPDANAHKESFGDKKAWDEFHNEAMAEINAIKDNKRMSAGAKEKAYKRIMENFNDSKEVEFPDWADANDNAEQDAKDAEYDAAQDAEWDAEEAAEKDRKEAEDTANTNRQNAERARREKAAADAAAASEREKAEESKKAQDNEDAEKAEREAKEAEDAYNAAQEAQATADKEAADAAQAETEEPKAEEAEPQSEDTSNDDASNEEPSSDDTNSDEDSNPENEHGVSHALHAHIGEWFKELNNRYASSTGSDDAGKSFKSMVSRLGMKTARNELTKEDLQGIQDHFNRHPADETHLRENWVDSDGNSKWNE